MNSTELLLVLLVFAPLASLLVNLAGYRRISKPLAGAIGTAGVLVSALAAWSLFFLRTGPIEWTLYRWIEVEPFSVSIGFTVDDLTSIMFLVVTSVSFCVHLYAVEYMEEDAGFHRFFLYLNLFVFSMLILVGADNLLMMFIGWEGVGVCSYLLIGFWHEREAARNAGQKAFIVNRVGDFFFLLGMLYIVYHLGTLEFASLADAVNTVDSSVLATAGLLLFGGAVGKSAQFPLHVWLPDAMEGPTPVSSLIHAATMVTAGVYVIARLHFVYAEVPWVGMIVAFVGALTALFAASMATVARDMKQILAFSTISQLGYMFVGVGMAAYAAGIFHLVTHAFFKGLLFLVAGAVMHALHGELDIFEMGGLARTMPFTAGLAVIGGLGLAGVPPLAGFWSKEEVLLAAWGSGSGMELVLFGLLLITSLVTAFYTARMVLVAFWGRGEAQGHEFGLRMNLPMALLAAGTLAGGWMAGWMEGLHVVPVETGPHGPVTVLSVGVALAGIVVALAVYQWPVVSPSAVRERFGTFYETLINEYYVDSLYRRAIVEPLDGFARLCWRLLDDLLIDGLVNLLSAVVDLTGLSLRFTQTGTIRHYLFILAAGLTGVLLVVSSVILLG